MTIQLNQNTIEFSKNTLSDLLEERDLLDKKGIAVAVNATVIPKDEWNKHTLNENDKILIITATQGG